MGTQKKYGKGRLDHYYRLAKEKGYRARSSFKIIQLNQKYGFFNQQKSAKPKPMCIIDLCAAPGSWCQVATQCCPLNSLIIGVDLAPIKPLPNVITFQSDITTDHCRSQLRGHLKTWKADVVMHDGAPNVGMAWAQDAFTQSELVLQSLKLAVEFLTSGGWFITKVFRSKDYNKLMWVFQQFFDKCEATKPPSSRNVSAEIFVVCRGFKAPKHIDPRLLDARYVFEELQDAVQDNTAKVYNPEKKRRKREGYAEGDYTQFKEISALEFVKSETPIDVLGETNKFIWDKSNEEIQRLKKLPQTTKELLACFDDLKVLGKKDFRVLLRWRLAARKCLELDEAPVEEEPEAPELTTEEKIDKELTELQEREATRRKRERRRKNEERQKEIQKMQLNMGAPMEIGIEAGNQMDSLFELKKVEKTGLLGKIAKAKTSNTPLPGSGSGDFDFGLDEDLEDRPSDVESEEEEPANDFEIDSEDEGQQLEQELDELYDEYKKRKEIDSEAIARKRRENELWEGIESPEVVGELSSDDDEDLDANGVADSHLSSTARMFFSGPEFNGMDLDSQSEEADTDSETEEPAQKNPNGSSGSVSAPVEPDLSSEDEMIDQPTDKTNEEIKMTLAHKLALGEINKHDLINEGYNKYSFRDRDGLPSWFLEDEGRHSRIIKPITKEAAAAVKEQIKALNARPIKKVAEARQRKQYRAHKRLERIRKKTEAIGEDSGRSEQEKADEIAKLMRRSTKPKRQQVTVVAAKGSNRGLQGRPHGVKGKYKMVDARMKKEMRALKRIKKH